MPFCFFLSPRRPGGEGWVRGANRGWFAATRLTRPPPRVGYPLPPMGPMGGEGN
jgi:hypothetical protein